MRNLSLSFAPIWHAAPPIHPKATLNLLILCPPTSQMTSRRPRVFWGTGRQDLECAFYHSGPPPWPAGAGRETLQREDERRAADKSPPLSCVYALLLLFYCSPRTGSRLWKLLQDVEKIPINMNNITRGQWVRCILKFNNTHQGWAIYRNWNCKMKSCKLQNCNYVERITSYIRKRQNFTHGHGVLLCLKPADPVV